VQDTLNLSSNELGNEEAIQLGYDLCHMFSLRTLVLAHNNIKARDVYFQVLQPH
jgi:hypothetical protein